MAVKIRLKRMGQKKAPFYRIVVADARAPRDGKFIEEIGTYDPNQNPSVFKVDEEPDKRKNDWKLNDRWAWFIVRLCGPPSIPLSFTVAGVLPRWDT